MPDSLQDVESPVVGNGYFLQNAKVQGAGDSIVLRGIASFKGGNLSLPQKLVESFCLLLVCLTAVQAQVRVGFIGPLSGEVASYGQAARNGIEMAILEQPEAFSNIRFIYEDDRFDSKGALSAYRKLLDIDKVDFVFPVGARAGAALAPVAQRDHIPLIGLMYSNEYAIGRPYVIRFANDATQFSHALMSYLRKKGYRSFGVVKSEFQFLNDLTQDFLTNLQGEERAEVVGSFEPTELDFRSLIVKLKSKKYDALAVFLLTGQVSQFYLQAKNLGLKPTTFGTDFFANSDEIQKADGGMEGAVFADNKVDEKFTHIYRERFGNDSQIVFAGLAYDFATLLASLFRDCESKPSAEEILRRFESSAPRYGVTGRYELKQAPDTGKFFDFPIVIKKIVNGKIEPVQDK